MIMMKNIIRLLLKNSVLANILMLLILFCGAIASYTMVREIFPEYSLDTINVTVAYPGADPEEVEEGVCLKLEEALTGIEGVENITVTAQEGVGSATVECYDKVNVSKVMDRVETKVNSITTFPKNIESPVVTEMTIREQVLFIALWGDLPERELKNTARGLEQELLSLDGISQVDIQGVRDDEIIIEISEQALRKYNLTFKSVADAVNKNSRNFPAGIIRNGSEDIRLRVIGRKYNAKSYKAIPVITRKNGTVIALGQIAKIRDVFNEDGKSILKFNGKPCVMIAVYKTSNEDAMQIAESIAAFLKVRQKTFPPNLHITKCFDLSRIIDGRLNLLVDNGIIGLILVILILWLFLDMQLSFWVAMGIPVSIAGGLIIMAFLGCSVNMITMFGLIMVLGLIVDDAIVIGESIYSRRRNGESSIDAVVNGTSEVALPVIAAVMTTIVAFLPLFFVGRVMGKFIGQVPVPIVAALSVSLLEGLFILPVHLRHLPKDIGRSKFNVFFFSKARLFVAKGLDIVIERVYGPLIKKILYYRYIALSVGIGVLLIIVGLVCGNIVKFVFFPKIDNDFIRAKVCLASGTPLKKTEVMTDKILGAWYKVAYQYYKRTGKQLTVSVFAISGTSSGRKPWKESGTASNLLEVMVELLPSEERNIHYAKLVAEWQKNLGKIPGAVNTKFGEIQGSLGGDPIEIKLYSKNHDKLIKASDDLVAQLDTITGVFDAQTDYLAGEKEIIITVKPNAYHLGLTLNDLAEHIREGFYGNEALRVQRDRDDIKVKVRYPEESRKSVEYFRNLRITTPNGSKVPLLSVADLKIKEGQSIIFRKDRKKVLTVSADVDIKIANAQNILSYLEDDFLIKLMNKYNVTYTIEGQAKEAGSTLSALVIGLPIAMFGIYFIIASLFKSYIQPIVIMTTIPFGLVGAIIGHIIFGFPLTIMSVFGLVGLSGIVVNDAIVLIEGVNERLEKGTPLFAALCEGGKRRFRAILLTTLTTFFGLMPLILEKSMHAQVLIPMAISIAFGVLFATVVTLVLIPCFVAILNDIRRVFYACWYLKFPSREEVEPRFVVSAKSKHLPYD
jgi:multidrug efflux pump subunit AcrB